MGKAFQAQAPQGANRETLLPHANTGLSFAQAFLLNNLQHTDKLRWLFNQGRNCCCNQTKRNATLLVTGPRAWFSVKRNLVPGPT